MGGGVQRAPPFPFLGWGDASCQLPERRATGTRRSWCGALTPHIPRRATHVHFQETDQGTVSTA